MRRIVVVVMLLLFAMLIFAQDDQPMPIAYTYQQPTGNKLVMGTGTFPNVSAASVQFDGVPLWVVGGVMNDAPVWVVALDDGRVIVTQPTPNTDGVSALSLELAQISPQQPIAVRFDGDLPQLLTVGDDLSPLSHPVMVGDALAYVSTNGDLVLWRDGAAVARLLLDVQADARLAVNDQNQIALYSAQTSRYAHGIMGDGIEGGALAVVQVDGDALTLLAEVELPADVVFEGIMPMWADMDDDGQVEIVTTVSGAQDGVFLRVYDIGDSVVLDSTPIGQGYRWRHQLAVGAFGINGETQLVDVLTPHIGGMVEFFDVRNGGLSVNNAQLGYTSHPIHSRNLDMALAGDFDGDGQPEVVFTDQAQQNIKAVVNSQQGVREVWSLSLEGRLSSNLAAVQVDGAGLALAAGTEDGRLWVWQSGAP